MHHRSRPNPHARGGEGGGKAACLAMFAKYWAAGCVKTRLGESIGMGPAAELHRRFVLHLSERLSVDDARHRLFVAPDDRAQAFAAVCPKRWQVEPQGSGDLGERMRKCFQCCLWESQRVVLIGSDCPVLTTERIAAAFAALADHDVVLGPACDGGYYLIGIRGPWGDWMERLFDDVPWSSDRVAAVTRARIREAGKQVAELPLEEDVDTLACLLRLDERLSAPSADAGLAAAVREALAKTRPMGPADRLEVGDRLAAGDGTAVGDGTADATRDPFRRSRS